MEPVVVLARTDTSETGRAAADWAEREAALRELPLRAPDASAARATVVTVGETRAVTLLDTVPGPVVLVPDGYVATRHRTDVVLGIDAREPSDPALAFAFDSARLRGARLCAVHAWALPPEAAALPFAVPEEDRAEVEDHEVQVLADALRPWRAKHPEVPVLEDVLLLSPAEALLHHRARAALYVVGGPPGSVVRALLRESGRPVAVVPAYEG
ncbi:universal stress protein [Streptomyces acidiscabies]|uniref:universal stress protein n=1 Tax=Streptomyces acidiscabies TaxID=42234 RepID=UPI000965E2F8|nr:universal stress protein [Streptomyces acidiscabies]GAV37195.1 universal stress protein/MT2085 [Streptomyces acidiscabies]